MSSEIRVLVAHPEQQHSYRLASALQQAGILDAYATTVYNKHGSLTELTTKLLPTTLRTKASRRRCSQLPDDKVVQLHEPAGLLQLLCMHVKPLSRFYYDAKQHAADVFSQAVAKLAIEHGVDAVVGYDATSPLLFETLKRDAPNIVRIMDMSAANTLYMREIYDRDLELKPAFANKLQQERKIVWDPLLIEFARREISAADYFLCGSQFVVKSLEHSGIPRDRCVVCPYGVDASMFSFFERETPADHVPVEFIYVGGTKELKGIAYLLDAFLDIDREAARLTVVGANNLPQELRKKYEPQINFTGMVLHDEVARLLQTAHVMVFPSLGEGFSLACLEGLAAGLPLIATENSGVNDIIAEGESGFVVPIQDELALKQRVLWFVENREQIPRMSRAAHETAMGYTWERYSQHVADAVVNCVERAHG